MFTSAERLVIRDRIEALEIGPTTWMGAGSFWILNTVDTPGIYIYPPDALKETWLVGIMSDVDSGTEAEFATLEEVLAYLPGYYLALSVMEA
jgi:hypothetical protein